MKKFRSKFFRVAVEGMTTDGRKIERSWIEQMAASYDRAKYGARIWMEHIRGMTDDSIFRAYGDVVATRSEEVVIDGEKRLALFAQIEPTDDLVNMNKRKQKIFTSIEVAEKFAGTGQAYLVGLAVTDTPASLGTEALQFAAQLPSNPLASRKQAVDNLFTAALETELEFEEYEDKPGIGVQLFTKVQALLKGKQARDDSELGAVSEAVEAIALHSKHMADDIAAQQQCTADLRGALQQLTADFIALKTELSCTPDPSQATRPHATGSSQHALTQF
ncbi:phage capsid protein [Pseudomonas sp. v388]|uniref:GPO family capsid scaffolding protein n=1 Tax=Pseudomonas sp. v388 TaxID=2479849 RepID=UPI000F7A067A|nr:GPO family capsid scaffolding protein [Pseudomonas sp. v388]RRV04451.1 phage capsid protein [Pseudomonas sp. v388]